jgi:peptide/nickel transport system ATP-binding protein
VWELEQLKIKKLKVKYNDKTIIRRIDFSINKGEVVCIAGESGCGKTTFIRAITNILNNASVEGEVIYNKKNLINMKSSDLKEIRWTEISYVFQNPKECLNPRMTLKTQLYEVLLKKYNHKEAYEKAKSILKEVNLEEETLQKYPHQLSGGMLQKFSIAMSICLDPQVIIFDEPTSSLDVLSKMFIVNIIEKLKSKNKTIIIVTHDLTLARKYSDKLIILYSGIIVESGDTKTILDKPMHMYTKGLVNSSVDLNPYKELSGIPGVACYEDIGCPFYNRCTQHIESCKIQAPKCNDYEKRSVYCNRGGIVKLLEIKNISKSYNSRNILKECNMSLYFSEIVSIIGSSGCGKSTLANIIAGFDEQFCGEIKLNMDKISLKNMIKEFDGVQMITQNPYDAINTNLKVFEVIAEPLIIKKIEKDYILNEMKKILNILGLPSDDLFLNTKVKSLSGGQVQRIAIARALIMKPNILIADEITSMMDPSNKANILKYLKKIQQKIGFSMIFITHDLNLATRISDRIYNLNEGKLVGVDAHTNYKKLESLIV